MHPTMQPRPSVLDPLALPPALAHPLTPNIPTASLSSVQGEDAQHPRLLVALG